jgi:hypothetical protein
MDGPALADTVRLEIEVFWSLNHHFFWDDISLVLKQCTTTFILNYRIVTYHRLSSPQWTTPTGMTRSVLFDIVSHQDVVVVTENTQAFKAILIAS